MLNTFLSRSLFGVSLLGASLTLASCGAPETQPEATTTKDTAQAEVAEQPQKMPLGPLEVLKEYNRSMKRGDSSAVNFATGKAATTKSYSYLKTSSSGFSITYSEPVISLDSATIGFRVTRENSASEHEAHLMKIDGVWKVERIENAK